MKQDGVQQKRRMSSKLYVPIEAMVEKLERYTLFYVEIHKGAIAIVCLRIRNKVKPVDDDFDNVSPFCHGSKSYKTSLADIIF
jgi:hypothetical protein